MPLSGSAQTQTVPLSSYGNPTRRLIADGALGMLPEILNPFKPRTLLWVMGKSAFRDSSPYQKVRLSLSGITHLESVAVEANPRIAFLEEMLRAYAGNPPEVVIGAGGGSAIDCAKALRMLLAQPAPAPVEDYLAGRAQFARRGLPFIAIPTTAGTGSEVTHYASLRTREQKKVSLTHPWLFPEVALIDPELTHTMPPYLTACSGLDALSQAIESFWSIHASPFSQTHSLRAVSLILRHFERVFENPLDPEPRFAMSLASCEAGLAISQSRTTAVHAVSYPLTTLFGIPHGHACALTLPFFIRYNASVLGPAQSKDLWQVMDVSSWEQAAETVERLIRKAGIERSLSKLGLIREDLNRVAENGCRSDRAGNNPREVTQETVREILNKIY